MEAVEERTIGYHGTSLAAVPGILRDGLRSSSGRGEWLVSGVYLFDEPSITLGFAKSRFGGQAAVLEVLYASDRQLDLTRFDTARAISKFGQAVLDELPSQRVAEMKQTSGIRELDEFLLTQAVETTNHRSVRAYFGTNGLPMDARIYPPDQPYWSRDGKSSWLNLHNHVQVCVIDPSAILQVREFDHSSLVVD